MGGGTGEREAAGCEATADINACLQSRSDGILESDRTVGMARVYLGGLFR